MPNESEDRRLCPTRTGGADPLIAHLITLATCQERQRGQYHKCFTCSFRNAVANPAPRPPKIAELERVPHAPAALPVLEFVTRPARAPVDARELTRAI